MNAPTPTPAPAHRPMFPPVWDSTLIGTLRSCPQKLFRSYIEHWKPQGESVHLHAGKAFATGIEAGRRAFYTEGKTPADSVAIGVGALLQAYGDFECPEDSAKSAIRMAGALEFYFDRYPLGEDGATPVHVGGQSGIEFSFAHPLPVRHPVTGDPLLYAGRLDMVAHAFGGIMTYDEKTTSSLGASWASQWDLRSQFTGYCWALQQAGLDVKGVVVRGISILKTKYDTAQVLSYRSTWEIDRWYDQVQRDITRAIRMWEEGHWDYNLDHACTEYGGCAFWRICKAREPEAYLPMYFERRVWDPLNRTEVAPGEWERQWGHTPGLKPVPPTPRCGEPAQC